MALLTEDEKLFKDLGVADFETEGKKQYVADQLQALQHGMWRDRVNLIINENIKTTSDEQKDQLEGQSKKVRHDLKATAEAVKILEKLSAELA